MMKMLKVLIVPNRLPVNVSVDDDLEEINAINLNNDEVKDLQYTLPKHHQCCVHTINLVETVVIKNVLK